MTQETWWVLNSGLGQPADNMAWDEALLNQAGQQQRPVLRFYGWRQPAATFGYFQKISDVEQWTALRPLLRRPTGGGLVPHEADWTYSMIFPPGHWWYGLSATESYRQLHRWIASSLARLQLVTELSDICAKTTPGHCFAGPEKFDLLWQGNKIAGAAQRRSRQGMLIQGSIQPLPPRITRAAWEEALCAAGRDQLSIEWETFQPGSSLGELAGRLAAEKYSQETYNSQR